MRYVAASVVTDKHTQRDYCNPAAHAPRVNYQCCRCVQYSLFSMYSVFSTVLLALTVQTTSSADVSSIPCSPVLHVLCVLNRSLSTYCTHYIPYQYFICALVIWHTVHVHWICVLTAGYCFSTESGCHTVV